MTTSHTTTDAADGAPARPRRAAGMRPARGGALARAVRDYRGALTAWLDRPLTSFHLVLAVFGLLTTFGLVMVLSASAVESFAEDGSSYLVFHRQLLYCVIGLVGFWVGLRVPLATIRRLSLVFTALCVGALIAVLSPLGEEVNGAQSWFVVPSVGSFQPSEVAKVALALWGAHVLVVKRPVLHRWRHLLVPVVPVALLMFGLIMLQPDLGTTITMAIVLLALLWFAGAPLVLFAVTLVGAVAGSILLAGLAEYRSDRIDAFLNPETADPAGIGYQANQAAYSLASGGWFGEGLGQSRAKWNYLPNAHNDFIFAIIGEELGFVGCLLVLALFGTLAYVGLRIAARCTDPWHRLVAAVLTTWLVAQAAINIGYVVGLLPVTGLTLPLISSGGTSILVTMLVFGVLANIARHEPQAVSALRAQGQGRFARLVGLPLPVAYRPPARRAARPGGGPRTSAARHPGARSPRATGHDGRPRRATPERATGHGADRAADRSVDRARDRATGAPRDRATDRRASDRDGGTARRGTGANGRPARQGGRGTARDTDPGTTDTGRPQRSRRW